VKRHRWLVLVGGVVVAGCADGRWLVYAITDEYASGDLVIADLVTGAIDTLTTGEAFDEQPAFSPDGQRVVS